MLDFVGVVLGHLAAKRALDLVGGRRLGDAQYVVVTRHSLRSLPDDNGGGWRRPGYFLNSATLLAAGSWGTSGSGASFLDLRLTEGAALFAQ